MMWYGPWDKHYNDGFSTSTCCATYVSWCLQDAGLVTEHNDYSRDIYRSLKENSHWEEVDVYDMSDMKPGDVGIYYDGSDYYHSNIYAGDSKFWDAIVTDEKVKSKGPTSNTLPTYVFRYQ